MISLNIDGKQIEAEEGMTILEAARENDIDIPTLCHLKGVNEIGACRMCIVEAEGARGFVTSCVQKVAEGMIVRTNTPAILEARKVTLDLILSNHKRECLTCIRNKNCELQDISEKLGMQEIEFDGARKEYKIDSLSPSIVRDPNKCILCKRCTATCKKVQEVGAIDVVNRGFNSVISPTFGKSLNDVNCVNCGQCIEACPVGALFEKDATKDVKEAINNPELTVIVQTAPAVRVALGEEFDMPIGTNVKGKMVTALKKLGFNKVFDTNFTADLTIMEEGTELIERIQNGGTLPVITSCSPGWIKFIETEYPELLENLSTCKSPQQMFGAVLKSYYAKREGLDPNKIYSVSVMPCVAKKFERQREEMNTDVDSVLTTRELARMIKEANIEFTSLGDSEFDSPLGEGTGAAVIFGNTGGVMEAALRTVSEILTGKQLEKIEFEAVRGAKGVKKATVKIGDMDVKIAVAHGLGNARIVMDEISEARLRSNSKLVTEGEGKENDVIKSDEVPYHFVEIMACPGGCVCGGGQPIKSSKTRAMKDVRGLRAKAIYEEDKALARRKSHENPFVQELYKEFLEKPGSHKAHELLHTHYQKRDIIK